MRSPWRFLADLTSRRKPQHQPPLLLTAIPEAQTDELDKQLASSIAPVGSLDRRGTAEAAVPDVPEQTTSPESGARAGADDTTPVGDAIVSDLEPTRRAVDEFEAEAVAKRGDEAIVSSTGKKQAKRIQQAGGKRPSSTTFPSDDLEPQPAPPVRPAFLDEVMTLDSEIADLRAALTQRLKQQNAQLRRMLERFEVR